MLIDVIILSLCVKCAIRYEGFLHLWECSRGNKAYEPHFPSIHNAEHSTTRIKILELRFCLLFVRNKRPLVPRHFVFVNWSKWALFYAKACGAVVGVIEMFWYEFWICVFRSQAKHSTHCTSVPWLFQLPLHYRNLKTSEHIPVTWKCTIAHLTQSAAESVARISNIHQHSSFTSKC